MVQPLAHHDKRDFKWVCVYFNQQELLLKKEMLVNFYIAFYFAMC